MQFENWINIRSGISEVSEKLATKPCKICYLGNSVTVQKNGYRTILHPAINKYFDHAHQPINAGIGGVGSLACAFFINDFVVRHKPDICFVECTTADNGGATPLHLIGPAVEGIIKQLLSNNISVCLLNLYRNKDLYYSFDEVFSIYERIADHYKIPSINIQGAISKLIEDGIYTTEEITYDGIHTTSLGAQITAEKILEGLKEIISSSTHLININEPLYSDIYQYTGIVPATIQMLKTTNDYQTGKFRGLIPYVEIFSNNEILFTPIDGELICVLVIADDQSGVITVDSNNTFSHIQLYDEWCEKERLQVIILDNAVKANFPIKLFLADVDKAERGANTTPNPNIRKAKSLKVIGFMVRHFDNNYKKYNLW